MHHLKLSSKVMSEISKVMENKVSAVNSENVADRFGAISQDLGQARTAPSIKWHVFRSSSQFLPTEAIILVLPSLVS